MNIEWKKRPIKGETVVSAIEYNSGYFIRDIENMTERDYYLSVETVVQHIICGTTNVFVYGDYDADGITSSAILSLLFEELNINHEIFLPCRYNHGYGIKYEYIKDLASYKDADTVITIDNGIVAHECVEQIKHDGKTVIIIDHHAGSDDGTVPKADMIINPMAQSSSNYDFKEYCAAGLALKVATSIHDIGLISDSTLKKCSVLGCIGTIGDVMPLTFDNRKIVTEGIRILKEDLNSFQKEMLEAVGINARTNAKDIAFTVVPLINALGRLCKDGAKMAYLILKDICKVKDVDDYISLNIEERISYMKDVNNERKTLCKEHFTLCMEHYNELPEMNPVVIKSEAPEGILGIIAGQLAEKIHKPVFIFGETEGGLLKGSARGYGDFHVKDYMDSHNDCFLKYGGHAGAGGYTTDHDGFSKLEEIALKCELTSLDKSEVLYYDIEIEESSLLSTYREIAKFEPLGEGIPSPVIRTVLSLSPDKGALFTRISADKNTIKLNCGNIKAFGFSMWEKFEKLGKPLVIDAIGTLNINYFNGKSSLQLELIDFKKKEEAKSDNTLLKMIRSKAEEKSSFKKER